MAENHTPSVKPSNRAKIEITQSMISMHEKCGMQFAFRYLDGIIVPPQSALTVGSSVDEAVTVNLSQKIQTKADLPVSDVKDAAATAFDKRAPETDFQGEDPGALKDVAIQAVEIHHAELAPSIQPIAVQKKIVASLGDFDLAGTLDRIEENDVIGDTKTSADEYDDDTVAKSLQPAVYSHLYAEEFGRPAKQFDYDIVVKGRPSRAKATPGKYPAPKTQRVSGIVSPQQIQHALDRAYVLHNAIRSGVFHYASEQGWWCSQKWCGYWGICPRGGKK